MTILPPLLEGLSLVEAVAVLNRIAMMISRMQTDLFIGVRDFAERQALNHQGAWRIAVGWPDTFYELLSAMETNVVSGSTASTLSLIYRDLREQLARSTTGPGRHRIESALNSYLGQRATEIGIADRYQRVNQRGVAKYGSRVLAAECLAVRVETITKLARIGRIRTRVHGAKTLYCLEDAQNIAKARQDNLSLSDAAELLGLSTNQVKSLLDVRLLTSLESPGPVYRNWLIERKSCELLLGQIGKVCEVGGLATASDWLSVKQMQIRGFAIDRLVVGCLLGLLCCRSIAGDKVDRPQIRQLVFRLGSDQAVDQILASCDDQIKRRSWTDTASNSTEAVSR